MRPKGTKQEDELPDSVEAFFLQNQGVVFPLREGDAFFSPCVKPCVFVVIKTPKTDEEYRMVAAFHLMEYTIIHPQLLKAAAEKIITDFTECCVKSGIKITTEGEVSTIQVFGGAMFLKHNTQALVFNALKEAAEEFNKRRKEFLVKNPLSKESMNGLTGDPTDPYSTDVDIVVTKETTFVFKSDNLCSRGMHKRKGAIEGWPDHFPQAFYTDNPGIIVFDNVEKKDVK